MKIGIENVTVFQTKSPVDIIEGADVLIEDDLIKAVGNGILDKSTLDMTIDGRGKILIPGNVCSHHHYYSALSRGMLISAGYQEDFIQVLKEWWWRLDRALDEESIYYSSLVSSMDAIAAGTTSVVDHHASPSYIKGSLDAIRKGLEDVGLRGSTCYEVTDRNRGMEEVEEGVEENVRFIDSIDERYKKGERVLVEGMIGGHALFTIPDEGLRLIKEAVNKTRRGMHLHVAEGDYDHIHSHHVYNKDIIDRLDDFGLLSDKTLLVHGVWLNEREVKKVNERGCFFAHNARSNMNNHIGYNHHLPYIKRLVLGTDGCGGNMFEEIKLAFFKHKDEGGPFWPSDFLSALTRGNELVESNFQNRIKLGRIESGYKADLVLLDYNSPTPMVRENAASHFVWGLSSSNVHTVLVDGKLVYEDHHFVDLDPEKIYRQAQKCAKEVWKRADKIKS